MLYVSGKQCSCSYVPNVVLFVRPLQWLARFSCLPNQKSGLKTQLATTTINASEQSTFTCSFPLLRHKGLSIYYVILGRGGFLPKCIFCGQLQKNCNNHDGTPKRQTFCVDCIAGWSAGGSPGSFWPKNLIFFLNLQYCMILNFWLQRLGCISQDTCLLYDIYWIKSRNCQNNE